MLPPVRAFKSKGQSSGPVSSIMTHSTNQFSLLPEVMHGWQTFCGTFPEYSTLLNSYCYDIEDIILCHLPVLT